MREEILSDKSENDYRLTGSIGERYITEELGQKPRHNTALLAQAINEVMMIWIATSTTLWNCCRKCTYGQFTYT